MSLYRVLLASFAVALVAARPSRAERGFDVESVEFFEKKVRPLLVDNCYNCHSANTNAKGGLRVDDRNGLLQGGEQRAGGRPRQAREEPADPGCSSDGRRA